MGVLLRIIRTLHMVAAVLEYVSASNWVAHVLSLVNEQRAP